MSYKGRYSPKNPQKYVGDPTQIIFRSLWERKVCVYLDINPNVLQWSSETIIVPYLSPIDNKYHRYFVDFWIKTVDSTGTIKEKLIEVKPYKQTISPEKKTRVTPKYIDEVQTWVVNNSKWKAAQELCAKKGWEFIILTEKELFKGKS
jgi:hypothetical protein